LLLLLLAKRGKQRPIFTFPVVSLPGSNECKGGGVALYVRDDIQCDVRVYMVMTVLSVCLKKPTHRLVKSRPIVGCIYRPPDQDLDRFNVDFDCLLGKITTEKAKFVLAGDYNVNLLKHDVHGETQNFVNNLYANFSMPVICRHTRFTGKSGTLIDNIITNDFHEDCVAGVMIADISDHLPVFNVSKK